MGDSRPDPWMRAIVAGVALFCVALVGSVVVAPRSAPAASGTIDIAVQSSADDAEQLLTGWLGTTSSDLELVDEFSRQVVGIRFGPLPIPAGAVVQSATIRFTVDEVSVGPAEIVLAAHDTTTPPAFGQTQPILGRPLTGSVTWLPEPWPTVGASGVAQTTPDLSAVVQSIVDRPDWVGGGSIAFVLSGSGTRTAESFDGGGPPVLSVTWSDATTTTTTPSPSTSTSTTAAPPTSTSTTTTTTAPPTTTTTSSTTTTTTTAPPATTTTTTTTVPGADSGVVTVRIDASAGDVEEQPSGWLYVASSDIELGTDSAAQVVGLRFAGIDIPRGATITSARVQFTADETSRGDATLEIAAHATGDATAFVGPGAVSTPATTTPSITWVVPEWPVVGAAGDAERTPDLSPIIQQLVSRSDWGRGNAIALAFVGTGRRTAEAFDGSPSQAPLLLIEWVLGDVPPIVNEPPSVTATASDPIAGSAAALTASIDDDGLPVPPGTVTLVWEQIDGPVAVAIDDPTAAVTTVVLPAEGEYRFRVRVTDGELDAEAVVTSVATPPPLPSATTRLAVIGDYGGPAARVQSLADLIDAWDPDAILTAGDNVYARTSFDRQVGRFFHEYIGGYAGAYGTGSAVNRFFPALGNHDYEDVGIGQYLAFFDLPGTERYYDVRLGGVHVFVVNSNPQEPDGLTPTTIQGQWLQATMAASNAEWKLVVFHHPPYSSLPGKSATWMRWPLAAWGADLVLNGDAHAYERLEVNGIPHVVNGLGINHSVLDNPHIPESRFFWSQDTPAAVFITACSGALEIEVRAVGFGVIDRHGIGVGTCP